MLNPSLETLEEGLRIRQEIDGLEERLRNLFDPHAGDRPAARRSPIHREKKIRAQSRRSPMSPEMREHLSKLAKVRWAKARRSGRRGL